MVIWMVGFDLILLWSVRFLTSFFKNIFFKNGDHLDNRSKNWGTAGSDKDTIFFLKETV